MATKSRKEPLDARALEKLKHAGALVMVPAFEALAKLALDANAETSAMTIGYLKDEEEYDSKAEFVPEIVLRIRRPKSEE